MIIKKKKNSGKMNIQKLFKSYIVTRKNGQCQILIPLIEFDDLCDKIENVYWDKNKTALEKILKLWANSQDLTTPPIQWAEEMAGIACDALSNDIQNNLKCRSMMNRRKQ